MLTKHVALVSEESQIKIQELTKVAAALQKQVTRDFAPLWKVEADVSAFARLEDVPLDYWPVIIKDSIDDPDAEGYHEDDHGQPFSLVKFSEGWTLTASHEVLEMLGDPFGRRLVAGQSPVTGQGRVKFLVEVCDPCEGAQFSYKVNGVQVSDFYTPNYFDPETSSTVRYSYRDAIKSPRQVLKDGYLSWYDPATKKWWQRTWFGGSKPADKKLDKLVIKNGNIRQALDRVTAAATLKAMGRGKNAKRVMSSRSRKVAMMRPEEAGPAFASNAAALRESIRKCLGKN
jgi:hypothetical protein